MTAETPAVESTALPAAVNAITFGADLPTSFGNALAGLAQRPLAGGEVVPHNVGVQLYTKDWDGVTPPHDFVLQNVVTRSDLGAAAASLEHDENWALLTPADADGSAIEGAGTLIVPCSRIARLHVY